MSEQNVTNLSFAPGFFEEKPRSKLTKNKPQKEITNQRSKL
jgi:hypothetical protein